LSTPGAISYSNRISERQTISVTEAAKILGCSASLVYRIARAGKLPGAIFLGKRRVVVSRKALEQFIANPPPATPPTGTANA
jgi:excisionase family DNA binding protein